MSFFEIAFFWSVFEQCIQRGCGGPELETFHDPPGSNQFLARLRHFQTPLKRRTLSLMFLGIAKNVEHTKEKTSGVRRNVGSFWFEVGSWKILGLPKLSFWLFQECISVFFIALIRSQSGHVFCRYHFRGSGATPETC